MGICIFSFWTLSKVSAFSGLTQLVLAPWLTDYQNWEEAQSKWDNANN